MICFFAILLTLLPAWAQDRQQDVQSNGFFDFYEQVISPVDGHRCPMYPSCSQYAKTAIHKHGYVIGWIMGLDRLVRCGRDEKTHAPAIRANGIIHIYDPVENNDFWWSKK
ncbi:MAG: membrane protein insertion efficiency factor YidD [Pseudomonadota bacterium]